MQRDEILIIRPIGISERPSESEEEFSIAGSSVVLVDKLREELKGVSRQISSMFLELDSQAGGYEIDEIELTLEITAEGKMGVLGSSVGGQALGGIKVKLRRRRGDSGLP
jgi:hypothetical protein